MNNILIVLTVVALVTQAAVVALLISDSRLARAAYAALSLHGGTSWDQIPDSILMSIEFHTQRTWAMACAAVGLLAGASAAFF